MKGRTEVPRSDWEYKILCRGNSLFRIKTSNKVPASLLVFDLIHSKVEIIYFSGKCKAFQYSGCGSNANNFQSFTSCQTTCGFLGKHD